MTSTQSLRLRGVCLLLTVGLSGAVVLGDSITLQSGKTIEGVVKQVDGGYEITDSSGLKKFIAAEEVKRVKLTNQGKVTEAEADERLASLQRSVESERSLDRIINRYRQFIQMNADTPAATRAEEDLKLWQSRREQKMTKVGKRWLTAQERDDDLLATAKTVETITNLLEAGRTNEAVQLVRRGLEDNPENLSLLYLNGVLQMRRGQYLEARRSFELVSQQIDQHAPTLLNTAVLMVQFKRWAPAVVALDQAMTSAPGNQEILDNVLEFTRLAPDTTRRSTPFERMTARFAEQEAVLVNQMAQRGLYRWGSRWVDQATLDQAKNAQAVFDKKKIELQAEIDKTAEELRSKADQAQRLERLIRIMEAESLVTDPTTGRTYRRAYPPAYFDTQRELELVRDEGRGLERRQQELRQQITDLEATAPAPPFEGKLKPIGERGVPVVLPTRDTARDSGRDPGRDPRRDPATQPATTRPTTPTEWRPPLLPPTK
jgi:Flp pilus assembly protein TadD